VISNADLTNILNQIISNNNNNVNNNVNENHITIAWPSASSTAGPSSSSASASSAASAAAPGSASSAACTPAVVPPPTKRDGLKATSADAQFAFPSDAWKTTVGVTGVSGTGVVGCDGKPAIRVPSNSLDDCLRYATSLRFATALVWNSTSRACLPMRELYSHATDAKSDVTIGEWVAEFEHFNATIPGDCAKSATIFSA
jgi:hypothetical protein